MRFVDTRHVRTKFDERVRMDDGTELSVDVYMPSEPGRYPALLTRTPYDNNRLPRPEGQMTFGAAPAPSDTFRLLASLGYVVAAQDVRGRGDSDGSFDPFTNEATDGARTVEWLADYSECDGRVGMFGAGYEGWCSWAAASQQPRGLVTLVSQGALHAAPSRGGVPRLDWLFWLHLVGGRIPQDPNLPPWADVWWSLPVEDMDEAAGSSGDTTWKQWLAGRTIPELSPAEVPALHITGWWDPGPLPDAHLIIGPWDHRGTRRPQPDAGGVLFGPRAMIDPTETLIEWFDEHLRGARAEPRPKARVFVGGRNEWDDLDAWPPRPAAKRLYLRSDDVANTMVGDGRLDEDGPGDDFDEYSYHPDFPLTWQPGFTSFSRTVLRSLVLDQTFAEVRDDVLVFTGPPLTAPFRVMGRPKVTLVVESDAPHTDFFVALSDFTSDERSIHLAHGVVRGPTGTYEIELDDVCWEFQPGHAVRVCVTSSLFPLYMRSLHAANVRVHHSSFVELP